MGSTNVRQRPLTLLSDDTARRNRIAAFAAEARELAPILGPEEVQRIVAQATKRPRGTKSDQNRALLAAYDAEAAGGKAVNVAALARRLDRTGQSANSIEKQIHRLLRKRAQHRAAVTEAEQRWWKTIGHTTTLLGSDK